MRSGTELGQCLRIFPTHSYPVFSKFVTCHVNASGKDIYTKDEWKNFRS